MCVTGDKNFSSARLSAFLPGPGRADLLLYFQLSKFSYSIWSFFTSAMSLFIMSSFLPGISSSASTPLNMVGMVVYGPVWDCQGLESPLWHSISYLFWPPVYLVIFECRDDLRPRMTLSSSYEDFKFLLEGLVGSRI